MSNSNKILVSMIAYREKYLQESVKDCYEKAESPENLLFSIVSEQHKPELHVDLSFIPSDQIVYRTYDLSEYRGVLWSRNKTTEVDFDYDYILFTCGHNRFEKNWDTLVLKEYQKALKHAERPVITFPGLEIVYDENNNAVLDHPKARSKNYWRGTLDKDYIPGYGWSSQSPVPETDDVVEETYLQYSWVFSDKNYVKEVPLDPDINYHAEEIYMTVKTWCAGWRMFASPVVMYYHDTYKEYAGEPMSRMTSHRPWSDINKDMFWKQSDESMIKLNNLLSGKTEYATKDLVEKYCDFSGLDKKWCEYNPDYDKLDHERLAEFFRDQPAMPLEW